MVRKCRKYHTCRQIERVGVAVVLECSDQSKLAHLPHCTAWALARSKYALARFKKPKKKKHSIITSALSVSIQTHRPHVRALGKTFVFIFFKFISSLHSSTFFFWFISCLCTVSILYLVSIYFCVWVALGYKLILRFCTAVGRLRCVAQRVANWPISSTASGRGS